MNNVIRIGTRGSILALQQARYIANLIKSKYPNIEIVENIIKTTGDKILDTSLNNIGSKGLFTKEIELALLDDKIDLAVHSCKDLPTEICDGLKICAITKRDDVCDIFVKNKNRKKLSILSLPENAKIATGSLRRKSQLLNFRKDIKVIDIRGNIETRINKLYNSDWDGIILAKAGIDRLNIKDLDYDVIPLNIMLPAVAQGALAVEIKNNNYRLQEMLVFLNDENTAKEIEAERALLRHLKGGCHIPVGALSKISHNKIKLDALVCSLDGSKIVKDMIEGGIDNAEKIGTMLAEKLLNNGGREILAEINI